MASILLKDNERMFEFTYDSLLDGERREALIIAETQDAAEIIFDKYYSGIIVEICIR